MKFMIPAHVRTTLVINLYFLHQKIQLSIEVYHQCLSPNFSLVQQRASVMLLPLFNLQQYIYAKVIIS